MSDMTPELSDKLSEATEGDIECNLWDGVAFLEFDRTAPSIPKEMSATDLFPPLL